MSEKNLLSYTQNVKGDFDIYLENRTFSQQKTPDYIDLNKVLFQSKEFFKMKAHEKYMLLDLIDIQQKLVQKIKYFQII